MRRFVSAAKAALLLLVVIVFTHTGLKAAHAGQPMLLPPHPVPLTIETAEGQVRFSVEIADDQDERARGLMFRRDLPLDRGMLFIFETTARQGFWMRNTPLPLDLVFVAENGRAVAIKSGVPFSEELIAPIYPVRFVLELHEGTAAKSGIRVGDRLRHPVINAIAGDR